MFTSIYSCFIMFTYLHTYIYLSYVTFIYVYMYIITFIFTYHIYVISMISTNMKKHLQWMLRWGVLIEFGFGLGVHSNLNYFPVSKTAESFYTLCLSNCMSKPCVVWHVSPCTCFELSWFGHRFACNHSSHTKGHPTSAGKSLGRESCLPLITLYKCIKSRSWTSVVHSGAPLAWLIYAGFILDFCTV